MNTHAPFVDLTGNPDTLYPTHDLGNGITRPEAAAVTDQMEQRIHILEMTSGTRPFPDVIPKYVESKVRRYEQEIAADDRANLELEARMLETLHNHDLEEEQRIAAMQAARDKVQLFQDIKDMGLDHPDVLGDDFNPFSPEGQNHLEYLSQRHYNNDFASLVDDLRSGTAKIPDLSQHRAARLKKQMQDAADADAKRAMKSPWKQKRAEKMKQRVIREMAGSLADEAIEKALFTHQQRLTEETRINTERATERKPKKESKSKRGRRRQLKFETMAGMDK